MVKRPSRSFFLYFNRSITSFFEKCIGHPRKHQNNDVIRVACHGISYSCKMQTSQETKWEYSCPGKEHFNVEIAIVTFVVKGSMKLTYFPTDFIQSTKEAEVVWLSVVSLISSHTGNSLVSLSITGNRYRSI